MQSVNSKSNQESDLIVQYRNSGNSLFGNNFVINDKQEECCPTFQNVGNYFKSKSALPFGIIKPKVFSSPISVNATENQANNFGLPPKIPLLFEEYGSSQLLLQKRKDWTQPEKRQSVCSLGATVDYKEDDFELSSKKPRLLARSENPEPFVMMAKSRPKMPPFFANSKNPEPFVMMSKSQPMGSNWHYPKPKLIQRTVDSSFKAKKSGTEPLFKEATRVFNDSAVTDSIYESVKTEAKKKDSESVTESTTIVFNYKKSVVELKLAEVDEDIVDPQYNTEFDFFDIADDSQILRAVEGIERISSNVKNENKIVEGPVIYGVDQSEQNGMPVEPAQFIKAKIVEDDKPVKVKMLPKPSKSIKFTLKPDPESGKIILNSDNHSVENICSKETNVKSDSDAAIAIKNTELKNELISESKENIMTDNKTSAIEKKTCSRGNNKKAESKQAISVKETDVKFKLVSESAENVAPTPRQAIKSVRPQAKKRLKFEPQFNKKFVQTKLFEEPEKTKVFEISEASIKDIESQLLHRPPLEVCVTMLYANGETQLSKQETSGSCKGLYFRVQWEQDSVEYYKLNAEAWKNSKNTFKGFLQTILSAKASVVCIEAAELMLYLIHKFRFTKFESMKWNVVDPLVGYWMFSTDQASSTFEELAEDLELDRAEVKKIYERQTKICKYLDVLSIAAALVKEKLKEDGLWPLFLQMEVKLTPILARMTLHGLQVDEDKLNEIGKKIGGRLRELEAEAQKLTGRPFLLNSATQLRKILFDDLKLDQIANVQMKETATRAKSTSEAVLRQLVDVHPLPSLVLEYRRLQKLKSTYVDGIVSYVKKGVVNTIWEQRSAATGRLASSNPNLQAIPKHWTTVTLNNDEVLKLNMRSAFCARDGYCLLLADFQQIEFRIFAHLSEDPTLIQIFHDSDDVFTTLAEHWLGQSDKQDREKTKRTVYAIMYGAGPSKLAEFLRISLSEASYILKSFCSTFPSLKTFSKKVSERCHRDGFLTTMQGRVRKLPHIRDADPGSRAQAERQALNFLIQGAAADICKQAMLLTEQEFVDASPPVDVQLLLQIHDELVWEVNQDDVERVKVIVKRVMEDGDALNGYVAHIKVPLRVKIQEQTCWADTDNSLLTESEESSPYFTLQ